MPVHKIGEHINYVGAIDWDRRLFDELIPLPDGTSYNSYLIRGSEKIALIDTVAPTKVDELLANLGSLGIDKIDYIVAHHAEQDHSGAIPTVLEKFPMAKIATNAKCKSMLMDLLLISADKFIELTDNEILSLGDRTLKFIFAPWVHWPETMLTYLVEDRILFSCDFLGAHLAASELYVADECRAYHAAKRYFAEIMMPFRTAIRGNLDKIEKLDIQLIAPSHGPLHKKPKFIIEAYRDWTSDYSKNEVLIPYVSMHGSTEKMVNVLIDRLVEKGVIVKPFHLAVADIGELALALVDAATIVLGTPTVLAGAHPAAIYAAVLVNALRPKTKFITIIGSYGWGGKTIEQITGFLTNIKPEILEPVISKGYPTNEDLAKLDRLANEIFRKHSELGIIG